MGKEMQPKNGKKILTVRIIFDPGIKGLSQRKILVDIESQNMNVKKTNSRWFSFDRIREAAGTVITAVNSFFDGIKTKEK